MDADFAAHAIDSNRWASSITLSLLFTLVTASTAVSQDENDPTAQQVVESSIEPTMPTPKLPYNMPPLGLARKAAQETPENAPISNGVALKQVAPSAVKGIGSAVPLPVAGSAMPVPGVNKLIRDAGGNPQIPRTTQSPAVIEDASGNILEAPRVAPQPAAMEPGIEVLEPKKKRRLFGNLFKGKAKKGESEIISENSTFISNLPGGPVAPAISTANAPRPSAPSSMPPSNSGRSISKSEARKNKFVIVEAEGGTQFFVEGEPVNGQSAILIPEGTVLQKMGSKGVWTSVESPNGTIGNVQTVAMREASFSESMQFIKADQ